MAFYQYKTVLLVVIAVMALIAATPAIQYTVKLPQAESLTEFSILGQYHNASYPANITSNQNYQLYFDVNNELGAIAYYQIQLKFRNENQSAPDSYNHTPSSMPSLGEVYFVAADKQMVELPVDISFQYKADSYNPLQINMQSITFDGTKLNTNGEVVYFNPTRNGFFGNVFFELWVYNDTTSTFQYHQRYLSLWLQLNL